jgi:hypothetical protein
MNRCNEYADKPTTLDPPRTIEGRDRWLLIVGRGPTESQKWSDPEERGDVHRSNSIVGIGALLVLLGLAYLLGRLT